MSPSTPDRRPDELERALQTMFERRSHDLSTAVVPRLPHGGTDHAVGDELAARRRPGRIAAALAAAACVVLLAGAALLGDHLRDRAHHSPAGSAPTSGPVVTSPGPSNPTSGSSGPSAGCRVPEPGAWAAAVTAAAVASDEPRTRALAATDDALLAVQSADDGTTRELALFDAAGRGRTIWRPDASGANRTPLVARSGALDERWVVFSTVHGQTSTPIDVYAYSRGGTAQARAVRVLSDTELTQGNRVLTGAPVVSGDAVYWIEQTYRQDGQQQLYRQDLSRSTARPELVATVADVKQLLVLPDGQVAYVHTDGSLDGPGVPATVTAASRGAADYATGSAGVRWVTPVGADNGPFRLSTWSGGTRISTAGAATIGAAPVLAGPFVVAAFAEPGTPNRVLDTRTGAVVTLGAGRTISAGSDRLVAIGVDSAQGSKAGPAGLALPAVSALPPTTC